MNNPETEDKSPAVVSCPEGTLACAVAGVHHVGDEPRGITEALCAPAGATPLPVPPVEPSGIPDRTAGGIVCSLHESYRHLLEILIPFLSYSPVVPLIETLENGFLTWTCLDEDDSTVVPHYLTSEEAVMAWIPSILDTGRAVCVVRQAGWGVQQIANRAEFEPFRRRRTFQMARTIVAPSK